MDFGVYCPPEKTNVLVTLCKVAGCEYNYEKGANYFYKVYEEQPTIVPLSMVMKKRDVTHPLNVDLRVNQHEGELKRG